MERKGFHNHFSLSYISLLWVFLDFANYMIDLKLQLAWILKAENFIILILGTYRQNHLPTGRTEKFYDLSLSLTDILGKISPLLLQLLSSI